MLHVKRRDFTSALAVLGRCAEARNTIPVLGAVKAVANGALDLSATDLDMTVDVKVPWLTAPGRVTDRSFLIENFRFIGKAINAAGGEVVGVDASAKGIGLTAGALEMGLDPVCVVEDFPADQCRPETPWLEATLSAGDMAQIDRVRAAISTEETRYYLNGVYFHRIADWTWRAAATDGHRLMYADLTLPDALGSADGVIIPRKAIKLACDLLRRGKDAVRLTIGAAGAAPNREDSTAPDRSGVPRIQMAGVHAGLAVRIATKTIDGKYPDYSRVIPSDVAHRAMFSLAQLRQAINAVALGFTRTPTIRFDFVAGAIQLTATDAPKGLRVTYRVSAQHDMPKDFAIGFNGHYLLAMLAALRGGDVVMGLSDTTGPVTLRDPAEDGFGIVLMPMRV